MASDILTRPQRRRILGAAAALMVIGAQAAGPSRGSGPVKLELELPDRRYLLRELMRLKVVLRNTSPAAVTIPKLADTGNDRPVYIVEGPSFEKPFSFTPRPGNPRSPTPPARAGSTQLLAPDETAQLAFDIGRLVPFATPGIHTLRARLELDAGVIESNVLRFELVRGRTLSARLMLEDGFQRPSPMRALFVVDDGQVRSLVVAFFSEVSPDYAGAKLGYLLRVASADAAADEALPTWTNYPRSDAFTVRHGWRSPAAIGMEGARPEQRALAAAVNSVGALRVQPALMTRDGAVEVFQATPEGMALWRFDAAPAAGRLIWQVLLPGPLAARAGRGRPPQGERPAVVIVSRSANGLQLNLVESEDGKQALIRKLELRMARLLPDSEPALRVDDQGRVHVALVVAADNGLRRVRCIEAIWPPRTGDGKVETGPERALPTAPMAAVAAFDTSGGDHWDWVARLPDGRLCLGSTAELDPAGAQPTLPLQLLVQGKHSYLLVLDANGVPALEALG